MKVLAIVAIAAAVLVAGCISAQPDNGGINGESPNGDVSSQMHVPGSEGIEEMIVNESSGTLTGSEGMPPDSDVSLAMRMISMTDSGFMPQTLTINQGETVTFASTGSTEKWPASAVHPTHQAYPGSGIEKCGTSEQPNIFDACRGLANGETFSFTFNEKGTWMYHNHMNPAMTGTIIVE